MTDLSLTPPCSPDMERAVLGAMMIDEDGLNYTLMHITQETFYKPIHQAIFRAIKLLWDEDTGIDQLTLAEKLRDLDLLDLVGGETTLVGLMNETVSAANIKYHCDELLEKESLRRIIALCTSAMNYSYEGKHGAIEILGRLSNKFDKIIDKSRSKKAHPMEEVIKEGYDLISKKMDTADGLIGLPTGYPALDSKTGGWQKGDMIVLAGRPSMGKTSLAFEFAVRAAIKGHPVGIFSLETTCRKIGMRMISTKSRQCVSNLHKLENKVAAATLLGDAANYLNKLPVWVDDTAIRTIDEIRAHAKRMQKLYGIELLIIDYLQIISGNDKEPRYKQITDISKGVKITGKVLDIPVMLISQLRRPKQGEEQKAPVLSDLRDAGGIEENADVVMFIHDPPDKWKKEYLDGHSITYQDDDLNTKRQIIIAKARDGAISTMLFNFQGKYYSFEEIGD